MGQLLGKDAILALVASGDPPAGGDVEAPSHVVGPALGQVAVGAAPPATSRRRSLPRPPTGHGAKLALYRAKHPRIVCENKNRYVQ